MRKRITITLDGALYEGLQRTVGKRGVSRLIEDLLRRRLIDTSLDEGYRSMAADQRRETEALEWCNGFGTT
ncbi:MAG: addiction module antitoxin [Burkholderiaceae bacterium]|nr:addiction module antitoxin [Burkholderiaceae bacterium]